MQTIIKQNKHELGKLAARMGADYIRTALELRGESNIILATGVSQFEVLEALIDELGIDWSRVTCFHLDEYVGMTASHPASFRKFLKERFVDLLPTPLAAFHYLNVEKDPEGECERVSAIISQHPIDVAFIGIGENGHIAFNDPPANFTTDEPYILVPLDDACRRQQLGEGWFSTFEDVPTHAVSMSVKQILKSRAIICTVPDERKAAAARNTIEHSVSPDFPSTILRTHADVTLLLDGASASLLSSK